MRISHGQKATLFIFRLSSIFLKSHDYDGSAERMSRQHQQHQRQWLQAHYLRLSAPGVLYYILNQS